MDNQGKVQFWNKASEIIFGWKSTEVIGQYPPFIKPEHIPEFNRLFLRVMNGQPTKSLEITRTRKDNTSVTLSLSTAPLFDESGNISGQVAICEDLTQRKNLESENEKLANQINQIQKMESIGRLAGGIAHDFNNLLVPISGYAEMAKHEAAPESELAFYLSEIEKAAERAANLTRQILAFSRQQILEFKIINLNELIDNFKKMLGRLIGENIQIEFEKCESLQSVLADPGQLEQVLLNLIINARDAIPLGGILTIETDNISLDDDYCQPRNLVPGDYVLLAVSDTGTGMTEEIREHIFEPFFTTKPKGEGTGLALATVFGIVKQHNGQVWINSEPGQGTTFKIFLPASNSISSAFSKAKISAQNASGHETILVTEDESNVRSIISKTLINYGYRVIETESAEQAIEQSQRFEASIDLLLTDVILTEMNGRELSKIIKKQHPVCKVLFMSGYTNDIIAQHGVPDAGVNFIQKPFTLDDLVQKIRSILDT